MLANRPAHPVFVPPNLVHPVVMTSTVCDGRFVEFRMEEHASHRVLSASRGPVNSNARDVVGGILRGDRLVPEDAVGKAGVAEVLVSNILKGLGPVRRA